MYIEYRHESEILKATLETLPGLQVTVHNLATGPETPPRVVCALVGSGCEKFDRPHRAMERWVVVTNSDGLVAES